jgi:hypothetical protein
MIIREAGARKGIRSASLAPLMHQAIDCVDASGSASDCGFATARQRSERDGKRNK